MSVLYLTQSACLSLQPLNQEFHNCALHSIYRSTPYTISTKQASTPTSRHTQTLILDTTQLSTER